MNPPNLCPCGSNISYESCCLPIHDCRRKAETAEELMRSRYSAFVKQHENHILASWHTKNRPKQLNFDDHPVTWLGLQIHSTEGGSVEDISGSVKFSSTYIENGLLCILQEESQFVKENNEWLYVGGKCQVQRQKVERNSLCPCGSGKKFKRCCLHLSPRADKNPNQLIQHN